VSSADKMLSLFTNKSAHDIIKAEALIFIGVMSHKSGLTIHIKKREII
jgi:hypothetical protein